MKLIFHLVKNNKQNILQHEKYHGGDLRGQGVQSRVVLISNRLTSKEY